MSLHFLISLGGLLVIGIVGLTFFVLAALGVVRRRSQEISEVTEELTPTVAKTTTSSLIPNGDRTDGAAGRLTYGCEQCRVRNLRECRCTIVLYRHDVVPKTSSDVAESSNTMSPSTTTGCVATKVVADRSMMTLPSRKSGLAGDRYQTLEHVHRDASGHRHHRDTSGDRYQTTVRHRDTSAGRRRAMKTVTIQYDNRVLQTSL